MPRLIPATKHCEHCGRAFTRADKPKMIYHAFMRLRFCSHNCSHVGGRHDHVAVFWAKVEKTAGCWFWTGGLTDKGYGAHHKDGRKISAHRYSYELHKGPLGKLHALHSCDTPRCVNPDHLNAGTHQQNMREAKERKRFNNPGGEVHPSAKLTAKQAMEVMATETPGAELARKFGVSKSTIYAIRNGTNWRVLHGAAA